MKTVRNSLLSIGVVLCFAGAAQAEKVTVSKMHICCGACVKAINSVVGDTGAKAAVDQDNETTTLEGDKAAVEKAINALAAAGFHGDVDNDALKMKDDSGAPAGKVKRLEVNGAHNCCGACAKAIKSCVAGVAGVAADTCTPKATSFVVEGDFDAAALVKALNDAGFHVTVK